MSGKAGVDLNKSAGMPQQGQGSVGGALKAKRCIAQVLNVEPKRAVAFLALTLVAAFACRRAGIASAQDKARGAEASAPYEAYSDAGGPYCGSDARHFDVACEPLSNCVSVEERRCEPGDGEYQAYYGAAGPYCGKDSQGIPVECQPRHRCSDLQKSICLGN